MNDINLRSDAGDGINDVRLRPEGADPIAFAGPFRPFDWTVPQQAATRRVENQDQNLALTLLSTAATYLFRDPTVTNVRAIIPRRTYEVDQNLALTLLPTTLKPLTGNNLDWMRQQQVQVRAIEPEQNRIILPTTLAPLTKANLDWMRPQQVQVRNIEPEQNRLILPTTMAPFIPQKASDDRSPLIPARPYEDTENLLLTLLTPTAAAASPFVPFAWERPTITTNRPTDLQPNLLPTLLSLDPAYAFRSPTVTNVRMIIPRRTHEVDPNLMLTLLPTTLRPFVPEQSDFVRSPMICVRQSKNVQNLSLTLLPTSVISPVVTTKPPRHLPMMGVGR